MSETSSSAKEAKNTGPLPHDLPFDGDPSWRVERELNDGTKVTIRPLVADDREDFRKAFQTISPQTRYLRFLGSVGALSEDMLTYLTDVDQKEHVALVAVVTTPDLKAERGIGIARFIFLEHTPGVVEAAITVVDDMQRKGLGTILLRELERAARARGVRRIRADVLADNTTMLNILEGAGAEPVGATLDDVSASPHGSSDSGDASHARAADARSAHATISYDIELGPAPPSNKLVTILRGAAETMSMTLRRLLPPSTSFLGVDASASRAAATRDREPEDGAEAESQSDPSA